MSVELKALARTQVRDLLSMCLATPMSSSPLFPKFLFSSLRRQGSITTSPPIYNQSRQSLVQRVCISTGTGMTNGVLLPWTINSVGAA